MIDRVEKELDLMLKQSIIEKINSDYASCSNSEEEKY